MARKKSYFEFKYLIDSWQCCELKKRLEKGCCPDKNGVLGRYEVLSLYFDSFSRRDFAEKISGEFNRRKTRLRFYRSENQRLWHSPGLESKSRNGIEVLKQRIELERLPAEKILSCGSFRENLLLQGHSQIPATIVQYQRQAFNFNGIDGLRITFDHAITGFSPVFFPHINELDFQQQALMQRLPQVLEIKSYCSIPDSILHLLVELGITQSSYSKYAEASKLIKKET